METNKLPYELLVRWSQTGQLQGAQIQYRYIIKDGKKIVGESLSEVEGLSITGDFPLADVMNKAQAASIESVIAAEKKMQEMQQQFDAEIEKSTSLANNTFSKYEDEIRRINEEFDTFRKSTTQKME